MQLRRVPLLVFRHVGMMDELEAKLSRGRTGNRPGDVLRMFRMFEAFKNDPVRQQMAAEVLKREAMEAGAEDLPDQSEEMDQNPEELSEDLNEENVDEGEEAVAELQSNDMQVDLNSESGEDFDQNDSESPEIPSSAQNLDDIGSISAHASIYEKVWKRYEQEYGFKFPIQSQSNEKQKNEQQDSVIRAWALEEAMTPERLAREKGFADILKMEMKNVPDMKSLSKDTYVDDFKRMQELKAQEFLASTGAPSRLKNSWFRKDKRDIVFQHFAREKEARLDNVEESRLIKRVLTELEAEEKNQIQNADNEALETALLAQRELIAEEKLSEDRASELFVHYENVKRSKKRVKQMAHDEDNVDDQTRMQMMSLLRAQYTSSKPVAGRLDIPIAGPKLMHGPNQGLTYAEQMLRTQMQKSSDASIADAVLEDELLDKNATSPAGAGFSEASFEEFQKSFEPTVQPSVTNDFEVDVASAINPANWKTQLGEVDSGANLHSLDANSMVSEHTLAQKPKLFIPPKFAKLKWRLGRL